MKKAIISTVAGVVGSAAITSSVCFNFNGVDKIEKNIETLKNKIISYANNETELINKYNKLYEEYSKLKQKLEDLQKDNS